MDQSLSPNDISHVVEADRAHVWHHLIQHKPFETIDPRIMVEGKGMRVWDATGKEHLDAVSGGVWTVNVGYGRERIGNAVRDQLLQMPYFAGSAGSIPRRCSSKNVLTIAVMSRPRGCAQCEPGPSNDTVSLSVMPSLS